MRIEIKAQGVLNGEVLLYIHWYVRTYVRTYMFCVCTYAHTTYVYQYSTGVNT